MKLSTVFYTLGFASIALSASQFLTSENADKERNGLFIGHWPPTLFLLGKIAEDRERQSSLFQSS